MVAKAMTRILAVIALLLLAAGCETTSQPSSQPRSALAAGPLIRGGFLATAPNPPGMPPRAAGPFTPLRGPTAVAARGPDVYIVDAGLGMLVRADPVAGTLVQLAGRPFAPGTRLALDVDGSFYVLDPLTRRVQRFSRDGRPLTVYATDATVSSLRDLALDPARGRLLAIDSLNRQLVAFRPLGVSFELLPLRGAPRDGAASADTVGALDAIAVAPDALYGIDASCVCLARIAFDGRVLSSFGRGEVVRPERIAAERGGRLFVYDRGDASLKLFRGERLAETIPLARFGLIEASDLAYADGWLYVADAPGAQVRMLRVQPLPKGGE
jgi:hypothetical protein